MSKSLKAFLHSFFYLLLGDVCLTVGILSIVLQGVLNLEPCVLCLIQRICFFLLGTGFLCIYFSKQIKFLKSTGWILVSFSFLVGISAALRQIWLEHLPPNLRPSCVPNLSYMVKILGPTEGMRRYLFEVGGGCGKEGFKLFGFSLAHYSLVGLMVILALVVFREYRSKVPRQI